MPVTPDAGQLAAMWLWYEVNQLYAEEADALDREDYERWLGLLTDDVRYWMPSRESRFRRDESPPDPHHMNFYHDDKDSLRTRIRRLETGTAWAEDPRTRYRHLVTNVQVDPAAEDGTHGARSNVIVYRNRVERDEYWLVARRDDVLRREAGRLRIASRRITLDQSVLLSKNLNVYL